MQALVQEAEKLQERRTFILQMTTNMNQGRTGTKKHFFTVRRKCRKKLIATKTRSLKCKITIQSVTKIQIKQHAIAAMFQPYMTCQRRTTLQQNV